MSIGIQGHGARRMNRYRSHKVVDAFKIVDISALTSGGAVLHGLNGPPERATVSAAHIAKHAPQVGGYYIRYPDGYESWSPAEAFESGYTLVEDTEHDA